jgi:uridine kinase
MNPRIVGIAGGTASGKTTVAQALCAALGERCLLLTQDRYYRSLPDGVSPADYDFDHPSAFDNVRLVGDLSQLKAGRSVRVPVYDYAQHRRGPESDWTNEVPRPVILVEGILVLADVVLRQRFDVSVFVDVPADIRLARRIRRDLVTRGRCVEDILDQYERSVRPAHARCIEPTRAHADHILDGTRPTSELVSALLSSLLP